MWCKAGLAGLETLASIFLPFPNKEKEPSSQRSQAVRGWGGMIKKERKLGLQQGVVGEVPAAKANNWSVSPGTHKGTEN